MTRRLGPLLLASVAAALFAAATPASKALLGTLPPFQLAGLLYLGAALAMLPALPRAARRAIGRAAADRRRLVGAVIAGGLVGPVLLLAGLRLAPAGEVSLLLNLEMAATAALGVLHFHEPLGRRGWTGVAGIVAGGALLSGGDWPGATAAVLVAAACLCWGLDNHLTALIDGVTPAVTTFWKGAVGGAVNLAIGLWLAPLSAPAGQIAGALAVGALAYGVSIELYIRAAQQLGAVRAQAVFACAPFLGAGLAYAVLGETLDARVALAGACMAVSAALLFSGTHAHLHRHPALEHVHSHRHDDGHHDHAHPDLAPAARHSHPHRHEEVTHAHPHWPDLHHRHRH